MAPRPERTPIRDEGAMQYLCLVYREAAASATPPACDPDDLAGEMLIGREDLRRSGRHLASAILLAADTTTTVRVRGGRIALGTDHGAATREQPGGFYLIEARDLNEAIRLAAWLPAARLGHVEVRPLAQFAAR